MEAKSKTAQQQAKPKHPAMINEVVTRLMRSEVAVKKWPDEGERFKNVLMAARDILRGYAEWCGEKCGGVAEQGSVEGTAKGAGDETTSTTHG